MDGKTILSLDTLNEMLNGSPFHRIFKMEITDLDEETLTLTLKLPFQEQISRAPGSSQHHGGTIASLIDIAGDFALIWRLGWGVPTINFRTDYLRPAIDTDLTARATIRKIGRTVSVCDIEVLDQKDRLVAVGRGTYATAQG